MPNPPKGPADYLALGDWNAVCSMCGAKFKASQLIKHWQGLYRCERCWEPRQPQDFVRGIPDNPAAPWVQKPVDVFVDVVSPNMITAIPRRAEPGRTKPGYISPMYDPSQPLLD